MHQRRLSGEGTLSAIKSLPETAKHIAVVILSTALTFYGFQMTPAMLSPYCCHWSCRGTRGCGFRSRCCRFHGFHCHEIPSHSHWTRCSLSPCPLRAAAESVRSCECCMVKIGGLARCCRSLLKKGPDWAGLGRRRSTCGAAPLSCTPTPPWRLRWCRRWTLYTLTLHHGPPAPRSNRAWSLNPLTSVGSALGRFQVTQQDDERRKSPHFHKGDTEGNARWICREKEITGFKKINKHNYTKNPGGYELIPTHIALVTTALMDW